MKIDRLDHLVLTVRDIEATCQFYSAVLGMKDVTFGVERRALSFGKQKINLHEAGREFQPHAEKPTPGSADLCFISAVPLSEVIDHLRACAVPIIEGPVERTARCGRFISVTRTGTSLRFRSTSDRDSPWRFHLCFTFGNNARNRAAVPSLSNSLDATAKVNSSHSGPSIWGSILFSRRKTMHAPNAARLLPSING